jgi:iron-sulfur cluster repair protein YtfE (RIC family)
MKNITNNISTFMNKEENLKFTVIKQNKKENEEDNTTQFVKEELKIQFETI